MVDGIIGFSQGLTAANAAKDALILRPGQILPGIVLEANPDNAVVLLNGINVVAELETSVITGEKLMLQVVEQRSDGKVLLQKTALGQGHGELAFIQEDLEAVLNHLGIKDSKLNETIVKELLQLKVPLTQRTVELLSAFALKNNVSLKEAPALTWLWARSLPITKESITAMASLMGSGLQDTKMGELLQALSKNPHGSGQEILSGSTAMPAFGSSVTEVVEQLLLNPEEPQRQWAQKLLNTLETLGLGHERDLLRLLELVGHQPEGLRDIKELPVLFRGEEGKTLKAALMEMLKPEGQPPGENWPMTNQIANGVLNDITGFQLLNITGRQEADGITTFIPGWMVMQENEIQPFFLKVKGFYGGSEYSEEDYRCQVLFFISTKEMGEVMCRLALENDCLTCGFIVRGQEECILLDNLLPVLQDHMQSLPWKTVIYPSKVSGAGEITHTWYEETFVTYEKNFKGLDARI